MNEDDDVFGEPIYSYTRAQAIEDGVLVDVTEAAREVGFRHHTVVTRGVWAECVALTEAARKAGNDERGRLNNVLWMASCTAQGKLGKREGDRMYFDVRVVTDKPEVVSLWAVCGPGDTPEPVITIMLVGED
jgi:hypothetical protein